LKKIKITLNVTGFSAKKLGKASATHSPIVDQNPDSISGFLNYAAAFIRACFNP
jgi:hypothetical protein